MYTEDRFEQILAAIKSVREQTLQPDEFLLVVDHNDELLEQMRELEPGLIVEPNRHVRGLSGARNTATEIATSDILVFLDDDARARPTWLERLVAPLDDPSVVGTGGWVEADWEDTPPAWFPDEMLWAVGCSYRGLPTQGAQIRNPFGNCMALRRQAVIDAGMFRSDIGRQAGLPLGCEETDMAIRLTADGSTIRFVPDAVVDHLVTRERAEFKYLAKRCYAEGLSKAAVADSLGQQAALETERGYVARVIPSGLAASLRQVARGPERLDGLRRAGALGAGVALAGIGYGVGFVRTRKILRTP